MSSGGANTLPTARRLAKSILRISTISYENSNFAGVLVFSGWGGGADVAGGECWGRGGGADVGSGAGVERVAGVEGGVGEVGALNSY